MRYPYLRMKIKYHFPGDAQTLAVTKEGAVYSWGDGDYGKLGRGGSDGSGTPRYLIKIVGYKLIIMLIFLVVI